MTTRIFDIARRHLLENLQFAAGIGTVLINFLIAVGLEYLLTAGLTGADIVRWSA